MKKVIMIAGVFLGMMATTGIANAANTTNVRIKNSYSGSNKEIDFKYSLYSSKEEGINISLQNKERKFERNSRQLEWKEGELDTNATIKNFSIGVFSFSQEAQVQVQNERKRARSIPIFSTKISGAKMGYNWDRKLEVTTKIGIVKKRQTAIIATATANEDIIIPVKIEVGCPLSPWKNFQGEIKGWTTYLLKDTWDEFGGKAKFNYPLKNINLGLSYKTQFFNPKLYFGKKQNEIVSSLFYNNVWFFPYVTWSKTWGDLDLSDELVTGGIRIRNKKFSSGIGVAYSYENNGNNIISIIYNIGGPSLKGERGEEGDFKHLLLLKKSSREK